MRERKHVRRREEQSENDENQEEMTLMAAFDVVVSTEEHGTRPRDEERAFGKIHEVIRQYTRYLVAPEDEGIFERADVEHRALMKLMNYGRDWRPRHPGEVRNFIRKTVYNERNSCFDRIRRNRERADFTGTLIRDAAKESRQFRDRLRELLRDCTILPGQTTMENVAETLWEVIEAWYLPEVMSARWLDNYLEALDELRRIKRGELTVDDLLEDEVEPDATARQRKKTRRAINKRHSRLREKLRVDARERRDELGLSDADLELLDLAARALEMRKQKHDRPAA